MKRTLLALLAAILSIVPAAAQNDLTPQEVADGWILLFDGQSMFGWERHGQAEWRVEGGTLVADSPKGSGWLGTAAMFSDFELKLEFRTATDGNSGVFLRSAREGVPEQTGYEVQIYDRQPRGFYTGSLVGHVKAEEAKIIPDQWNTFYIVAEGDHFTVMYNGRKVLDGRDSKAAVGHIGLQYNNGRPVAFRAIKLRPLGMKPLFNGKDLTGWTKVERPGGVKEPPVWSVRDQMIHVEKGPGQLETEGAWDNFVLQLDIRTNTQKPDLHPNSGVFFRGDKGGFWTGYESQIRNEFKGSDRTAPVDFGTGGLYFYQPARRVVSSDNQFFTKTIVAWGRDINIWVNGIQTASYKDTREEGQDARKTARLAPGVISLQAHDPTTNLDFRTIRLAPLPKRDQD
jgi:hypothetical protein